MDAATTVDATEQLDAIDRIAFDLAAKWRASVGPSGVNHQLLVNMRQYMDVAMKNLVAERAMKIAEDFVREQLEAIRINPNIDIDPLLERAIKTEVKSQSNDLVGFLLSDKRWEKAAIRNLQTEKTVAFAKYLRGVQNWDYA